MSEVMSYVVKKDKVRAAEPRSLGGSQDAIAPAGVPSNAGSQPQARIVQQNDQSALVEVVCPCGTKFHLNCLFATQSA